MMNDTRNLPTRNLHVTNTIAGVLSYHHLGEALDALVVDDLPEADPGGLGLGEHLAVLALDHGSPDSQS